MSAAETAPSESEAREAAEPKDASSLWVVTLRDVAIVVAAFSIWGGAEAWATTSGLGLATAVSVVGGLLVGAFVTAEVHEWGHFIGARTSGATAPICPAKGVVPLFQFDFERSREEHFRAMSIGGNVGHWLAALFLFVYLPGATAGEVAIQAGAFGFAVFASTVEFPVIRRVFAGEPGAKALTTITAEKLERAGLIGFATALLLLLVLR